MKKKLGLLAILATLVFSSCALLFVNDPGWLNGKTYSNDGITISFTGDKAKLEATNTVAEALLIGLIGVSSIELGYTYSDYKITSTDLGGEAGTISEDGNTLTLSSSLGGYTLTKE